MRLKQVMGLALAIAMVATVFAPAVSAAGEGKGIDLNVSIKEPKPEIAITVDVDHISFGELLPGETSASFPVAVTNVGLKTLSVDMTVEDNGSEPIFVPGITVNDNAWSEYSSTLISNDRDSFDVALQIPETAVTRGDVSGSLTVWAEAVEIAVANFTSNWASALDPLSMRFTDLSANSPTSWRWDFGDGNTSTEQNPVHAYSAAGNYTVSLTVDNAAGSDTVTKATVVKLNIYSTTLANINLGAPDPGIPGFVGPDGDGVISTQRLSGGVPTNNYVNPVFTAWASKVIDYYRSDGENGFNIPSLALGPVTGNNFDVVSLGDLTQAMIDAGKAPGSITLGFNVSIVNGPGADFACFENGFGDQYGLFAELGYVEVSTDGVTFVRFPSVSMTYAQPGGYGSVNPTDMYNLMGKHANAYGASWGTPFDLSDLADAPAVLDGSVDLNDINYVRIVDIPGSGDFLDSWGHPIYDPWLTYGSGGLDLEAVGVINSQPKSLDADFSADVTSGEAPLTVQFTDQSVGATSWAWDFDNDGTVDSTEQNPSCTYDRSGIYTVKLTVYGLSRSDDEIKTGFITIATPPGSSFTYTSSGNSVTITGYVGPGGDVVISSEIDGRSVTAIASIAFLLNANVTSIVLPGSVITIGNNAFDGCTALTSVIVNGGAIGDYAFRSCTALTSVTLGSGVTSIGQSAFNGCTKLTSVAVPDSVTSLGNQAFQGCQALTSATIGDGVKTIGVNTFYGCSALTSVLIGNGVTSIGTFVFNGCTALVSMTFEGNAPTVGNNWARSVPSSMIVYYYEGAGFVIVDGKWNGFTAVQLS